MCREEEGANVHAFSGSGKSEPDYREEWVVLYVVTSEGYFS